MAVPKINPIGGNSWEQYGQKQTGIKAPVSRSRVSSVPSCSGNNQECNWHVGAMQGVRKTCDSSFEIKSNGIRIRSSPSLSLRKPPSKGRKERKSTSLLGLSSLLPLLEDSDVIHRLQKILSELLGTAGDAPMTSEPQTKKPLLEPEAFIAGVIQTPIMDNINKKWLCDKKVAAKKLLSPIRNQIRFMSKFGVNDPNIDKKLSALKSSFGDLHNFLYVLDQQCAGNPKTTKWLHSAIGGEESLALLRACALVMDYVDLIQGKNPWQEPARIHSVVTNCNHLLSLPASILCKLPLSSLDWLNLNFIEPLQNKLYNHLKSYQPQLKAKKKKHTTKLAVIEKTLLLWKEKCKNPMEFVELVLRMKSESPSLNETIDEGLGGKEILDFLFLLAAVSGLSTVYKDSKTEVIEDLKSPTPIKKIKGDISRCVDPTKVSYRGIFVNGTQVNLNLSGVEDKSARSEFLRRLVKLIAFNEFPMKDSVDVTVSRIMNNNETDVDRIIRLMTMASFGHINATIRKRYKELFNHSYFILALGKGITVRITVTKTGDFQVTQEKVFDVYERRNKNDTDDWAKAGKMVKGIWQDRKFGEVDVAGTLGLPNQTTDLHQGHTSIIQCRFTSEITPEEAMNFVLSLQKGIPIHH